MRAVERCGCGASIDIDMAYHADLERALSSWRVEHQHTEPDTETRETSSDTLVELATPHAGTGFGFQLPNRPEENTQ